MEPGWTPAERSDGGGSEAAYASPFIRAELTRDCHGEPRRFDLTFPRGAPTNLTGLLAIYAPPAVITPDTLTIVDREGHFRAYVLPHTVKVTLRKAAGPEVITGLLAWLEHAANPDATFDPALCPEGALPSPAGADPARCNRCLQCVRALARPHHTPPAPPAEDEERDA